VHRREQPGAEVEENLPLLLPRSRRRAERRERLGIVHYGFPDVAGKLLCADAVLAAGVVHGLAVYLVEELLNIYRLTVRAAGVEAAVRNSAGVLRAVVAVISGLPLGIIMLAEVNAGLLLLPVGRLRLFTGEVPLPHKAGSMPLLDPAAALFIVAGAVMRSSADRAYHDVVIFGERPAAYRAELVFKSCHLNSFLSTFCIIYNYVTNSSSGYAYTFYSIPHSGTDFNKNRPVLCEN